MNLSNKQKALLHTVPAALGIDEPQRRIIQRNVGGFYSAADATCTRPGFIAVMAHYECCAGGKLDGFDRNYWKAARQLAGGADALIYACRREAQALGWKEADLSDFLASKHMSSGYCDELATAPAYWLSRLLTALKAMRKRTGRSDQRSRWEGRCADARRPSVPSPTGPMGGAVGPLGSTGRRPRCG